MGSCAFSTCNVKGGHREQERWENISSAFKDKKISTSGSRTSRKDARKKDAFQLSSFPTELVAYLKRIQNILYTPGHTVVQPLCCVSVLFVELYLVVICYQLNGEQTGFELYSFDKRDSCIQQLCTKCLQCACLLSTWDSVVTKAKKSLFSWDEGRPL